MVRPSFDLFFFFFFASFTLFILLLLFFSTRICTCLYVCVNGFVYFGELGSGFTLFLWYNTCSFEISVLCFFFFIKKNFLSVLVCMVTEETVEEEKRYDLWLFLLVTGGSWFLDSSFDQFLLDPCAFTLRLF